MIDGLVRIGLSNTCLALLLALVAMLIGARTKRPQLAHLLWLLVLIRLVAPPVISIPIPWFAVSPASASADLSPDATQTISTVEQPLSAGIFSLALGCWEFLEPWLVVVWIVGSTAVLSVSLVRVVKFDRLLRRHAHRAPHNLLAMAEDVARRLKLRSLPEICVATADISPLVWWSGGCVRVFIPAKLLEQLETHQLRWVLAHELAHVARRDYLVRWLEWLAGVWFWWNPVVWCARRNLRAMEEICCDALVISTLQPEPSTYASSILTAIEFLARPIIRPPAMASEINSGGFLERRFNMMISYGGTLPKFSWQRSWILVCGLIVLPVGVYAQDYDAVGKRLKAAVAAEEISPQQAAMMMGALKRSETDSSSKEMVAEETLATVQKTLKSLNRRAQGETGENASEKRNLDLDLIKQKIKAAMDAGDLSPEGAEAKMRDFKKQIAVEKENSPAPKEISDTAKKKLKALNDRGELAHEKADTEIQTLKQAIEALEKGNSSSVRKYDLDAVKKKLSDGIYHWDLAREKAEGPIRTLKKWNAPTEKEKTAPASEEDLDTIKKKLKTGIDRGDVPREKAESEIQTLKKRIAEANKEKTGPDSEDDLDATKKKLKAWMERGDLSREKAETEIRMPKKRIAAGESEKTSPSSKIDLDALKKKIDRAVERGDISKGEADAIYRGLKN